jgi:Oxidoreductase family, NAD-binding Rossmann fold
MNSQPSTRRTFLRGTIVGAAGLTALRSFSAPIGANGDVRVAVIGFNGRGGGHIKSLEEIPGVRIVALCDVDSNVLARGVESQAKKNNTVTAYTDFRKLMLDPEVDAVTIATPNHTHTLIAMTAMKHGKHVYVEKPVCHNIWEGRQLVNAAEKVAKRGIVVQHGMQRRSSPGWQQAMDWVKEGHIGKVTLSRGINYKKRESIGKLATPVVAKDGIIKETFHDLRDIKTDPAGKPQKVDVDYTLWSGPRAVAPVARTQFHYDWHWQWAFGNGDIGNQGPHQTDVGRWALGDPELLPKRVMSFGGRWGYQDDGQTANNQMAFWDYEPAPLLFDNRGLPLKNMDWKLEPVYRVNGKTAAARVGNVIHCEGGYVIEAKAYDKEGKTIKKFDDFDDGADHMLNFINSVRAGKLIKSNLHVSHGFHAASLAHLANISYRLGKATSVDEVRERLKNNAAGLETYEHFVQNLQDNKIDLNVDKISAGPWLEFDPVSEKFTGEFAEEANKMIKEEYAPGFELPEIS